MLCRAFLCPYWIDSIELLAMTQSWGQSDLASGAPNFVRLAVPAYKRLKLILLPEHQPLPVWKHSGSKRERFAAACCEIQRKGDPSQGVASHGKCEG